MRTLFTLDRKDYDPNGTAFVRPSVRGIILRGGRIAMVHSLKYNYYKFPGGGMEPSEDHHATLIREVREESGLAVLPGSIREFGLVHRIERGDREDIFIQDNFYYLCEVEPIPLPQHLDDYEADERFTLEWITPETAIATNRENDHGPKGSTEFERDTRVLELLIQEGYFRNSQQALPCAWEHNGEDSLIYALELPGVAARGASRAEALGKLPKAAERYLLWRDGTLSPAGVPLIVQEKVSDLRIADADSDILLDSESGPLSPTEYAALRDLCLKSATDFLALYMAVPDKDRSDLPVRKSFYGPVPRTAREMYEHTKNVNAYYFGEIGIDTDNDGTIPDCRQAGFALLEQTPGFLENKVIEGSYNELWSLKKLLRRFLWHDRIHARAMYRMACKTFGENVVPDLFCFDTPLHAP